ncbi:XRE family transcriptional regulator [Paraburkholderia sp. J63]|uniref:XRE family transcriptional regulator n=1 Tax=Paraburkholderia sp. J63 TaxID=2805434 RepID=UPI002ABE1CBC|nr:XRE family transcriptional regulator [Paraburkholderia sp. J63]
MQKESSVKIRPECLKPAIYWEKPTGAEIQEIVRQAGFTGRLAADYLDLADKTGRQIRRWISGETDIPYSAWALLCHAAGHGAIWDINADEMRQHRRALEREERDG